MTTATPTRPAPELVPADDAAKLAAIGELFETILERTTSAEYFLNGLREAIPDGLKDALHDALGQWVIPDIAAAAWRGCDLLNVLERDQVAAPTAATGSGS